MEDDNSAAVRQLTDQQEQLRQKQKEHTRKLSELRSRERAEEEKIRKEAEEKHKKVDADTQSELNSLERHYRGEIDHTERSLEQIDRELSTLSNKIRGLQ